MLRRQPVVTDEEVREHFGQGRSAVQIERVKNNDPALNYVPSANLDDLTDAAWERLGSYIAGNDYVKTLNLSCSKLDDSKIAAVFRGLTASSSLTELILIGKNQNFGPDGIRSMRPFLRNSPSLARLSFDNTGNIDTEGFDLLMESLDGGGTERMVFDKCSIESLMALGRFTLPKLKIIHLKQNRITDIPLQAFANYTHLVEIDLSENEIGERGFRAISNLLRDKDCNLSKLCVKCTGMGDREAEIIAASLACNTKLCNLKAEDNEFGYEGLLAFLKLLLDVSSIGATGNSNHTLMGLQYTMPFGSEYRKARAVEKHLMAAINMNTGTHKRARTKILATLRKGTKRTKRASILLDREKRAEIARLQGVQCNHLCSGLDHVLLPNALELVGETGNQSEMFRTLLEIAPDLVSLIDRKAMLRERLAKNTATINMLSAENSRIERQLMCIEADEEMGRQLSGKKRGAGHSART